MFHRASRRRMAAMFVVLALAASLKAAEPAAILNKIPDGTPIFIAIPNLKAFSDKVAKLNQQLGLQQPEMEDVLGMAKGLLGLNQGLREDGGLAVAILALPDPNLPGSEPQAVIIAPITDYAQFVGNFGVQPAAGGGVTQIEMMGDAAFAKQAGDFAILSDNQQAVANFKEGTQPGAFVNSLGQMGKGVLTDSDAMIYFDFAKVGPAVQPFIQAGLAEAEQNLGQQQGPEMEMARQMIRLYGNAIQAFINQGQAAAIGFDLQDSGVGLSFTTQFRPGSAIAQDLAQSPAAPPRFNRLPNRPYIMALSLNHQAVPLYKWMEAFGNAMGADNPFGAIIRNSLAAVNLSRETQQAYYAPSPAAAGASLFEAVSVYATDKPQDLMAANKKAFEALNQINFGPQMSYTVTYTANALQVAGKPVDRFSLKFNMPPEAMAQMGPMAMFLSQPMTGHIVATDQAVIVTQGGDQTLIADAIAAAGGQGQLEAAPGIAQMRRQLPPGRAMEMYINVGTIMQMASAFMVMFAPDVQINVPADLPPVAIGVSVGQGGMLVREIVPMPVIKTISDVIQKFAGMQGGAGGAPQPGADLGGGAGVESENLVQVTDANFDAQVLKSSKPVLVDFWAVWSAPSKTQSPIINQLADQYAGKIVVARVDVDRHQQAPAKMNIDDVPTLLLIKNGQVVQKFVGVTPKAKIEQAIQAAMK